MSEMVFARPDRALRTRLVALAVVGGVVFAAVSAYLGLSFIGVVGRDVPVTVEVTTLGDSLGVNSSVKFRGLRIGRVLRLENGADSDGTYTAHVVIEREFAGDVPRDVVARVLPGTIFGADYVDLVVPDAGGDAAPAAATGGARLESGQVVHADTSAPTVRLMDTFSATQRVLGAIDPASMDEALSQLATALDGRGEDIRGWIARANDLLRQAGAAEPDFYADLALLSRNLTTFSDLEPTLMQSLEDSLPTARTIAAKARSMRTLVTASTRLTGSMADFLVGNADRLVALLDAVRPTYDAFAGGVRPFNAILAKAVAVLRNGAFAVKDGAIQMRAQFNVDLVNPYTAKDCPRYGAMKGRNCR
jgi:virulence factor Mce-like protein